jgi:N-acetylglucosaminyldiphosphoundecaprenol N-acetyl-beta-D-mannosaminyltransferase
MNLNIKVDKISLSEARNKVVDLLSSLGQFKIFTPNPEMYVKAQKDKYFMQVLNSGDLNLCDGFGLSFFYRTPRIPGADFIYDICAIVRNKQKKVFLLGSGDDEVIKKSAENLIKKTPGLIIVGTDKGEKIEEIGEILKYDQALNDKLLEKINNSDAEILFVGFGMGKQEKWIEENLIKIPKIKIAMGVGGTFDFISGKIQRTPCFMRQIGLEWVYRLIQEPRRIKRIWHATAVFIWKLIF